MCEKMTDLDRLGPDSNPDYPAGSYQLSMMNSPRDPFAIHIVVPAVIKSRFYYSGIFIQFSRKTGDFRGRAGSGHYIIATTRPELLIVVFFLKRQGVVHDVALVINKHFSKIYWFAVSFFEKDNKLALLRRFERSFVNFIFSMRPLLSFDIEYCLVQFFL